MDYVAIKYPRSFHILQQVFRVLYHKVLILQMRCHRRQKKLEKPLIDVVGKVAKRQNSGKG